MMVIVPIVILASAGMTNPFPVIAGLDPAINTGSP
jgi:hypothetical protein